MEVVVAPEAPTEKVAVLEAVALITETVELQQQTKEAMVVVRQQFQIMTLILVKVAEALVALEGRLHLQLKPVLVALDYPQQLLVQA
jgi:hypothetical protein